MRIANYFLVFILFSFPAQADLYKCKNSKGVFEYRDTPCMQSAEVGKYKQQSNQSANQPTQTSRQQAADWQAQSDAVDARAAADTRRRLLDNSMADPNDNPDVMLAKRANRDALLNTEEKPKSKKPKKKPHNCQTIGDTTKCDNGTSYTKYGDTVIGTDGSSSTRFGDTSINSDGSTSRRKGNTIENSDGTRCEINGDQTTCY